VKAGIVIDPYRPIGKVDPKIYGQFLCRRKWVQDEALYNPDHPDADETGLRKTVVRYIAESAPPIIRWPGGCTGTSYDWRDGIGPRDRRPRTLDVHFGFDVSNGFGTAEFIDFCRRVGAEPHFNLNTGFGTLRDAIEWIEYCNYAGHSKWANLRRAHGYEEPFNVRYWQIGNENYGPWEIGHHTAEEYGTIAREWGKTIKKIDPTLKVLAVGGSKHTLDWDHTVLRAAWPHIDYITAHRYWDFSLEKKIHKYEEFAAVGYMEEKIMKMIDGVIESVARDMKSVRRPKLAFTEWNAREGGATRRLRDGQPPLRAQYCLLHALTVAQFINAMQRQCNLATLANLAQSINVVGLLTVTEERVLRETIYWALAMQRFHSGPTAVDTHYECDGFTAQYEGREEKGVPYLYPSATLDEQAKRLCLSVTNAHRTEEIIARVRVRDAKPRSSAKLHRLWHEDPFAQNTFDEPEKIVPVESRIDNAGADFEIALPPHSYSILELDLR